MLTVPARVHVILARESSSAIIIRRGPSKRVCTIGWDRKTDRFTTGQWLKGRIYERRCDLTPDGKHFIYFAMNGKWESETKGSWTAISRTPYLKAEGLWVNGSGWNGGGLFIDNKSVWINEYIYGDNEVLCSTSKFSAVDELPHHENYGGECPGVYYVRLQRDDWRLVSLSSDVQGRAYTEFEKTLPKGWVLEKRAYETINSPVGKGCYYDEHVLKHREQEVSDYYPDWEWADYDGKQLMWTEKGVLYKARVGARGLEKVCELRDFNDMEFEGLVAPY